MRKGKECQGRAKVNRAADSRDRTVRGRVRPEEKEIVSWRLSPLKEKDVDEGRPSMCNTAMTALSRGGTIVKHLRDSMRN